jgi:membrane-associated phospholipid phosphatase
MSTREALEGRTALLGPVARRTLANLGAWLMLLVRPPVPAMPNASPDREGRFWLLFIIGAVLAIAASMLVLDGWAIAQQRQLPAWVVHAFAQVTSFGKSGWFLWPIAALVAALAGLARSNLGRHANLTVLALAVRLEFVFFAIGIPALLVSILKRLIGRVRPSAFGPFYYVPFSWRPDYASMPSGHSTAAFAAAFAIGAVWPRARVPMWIYAGVIAISRVAVHAHFPSDVIAGAFVGTVGALLVRDWFAARRLAFARTPQGAVRPLPGPSRGRSGKLAARMAGMRSVPDG